MTNLNYLILRYDNRGNPVNTNRQQKYLLNVTLERYKCVMSHYINNR